MLAVGIFGLASVGAISLMNRGLTTAQASLETAMARQEIDTQAEALRFIHDAYLTEPTPETTEDLDCEHNITSYHTLWQCIVRQAYTSTDTGPTSLLAEDPNFYTREVPRGSTCDSLFTTSSSAGSFGLPSKSFILNPRLLSNYTTSTSSEGVELSTPDFTGAILTQSSVYPERFRLSGTYPRLIFSSSATALADDEGILSDYSNGYKNKYLQNAEGIWITAVASNSTLRCNGEDTSVDPRPDFYDFKIQTCWDAPGGSTASTISSTVRLFNPDQIPSSKAGGNIEVSFDEEWEIYDDYETERLNCYEDSTRNNCFLYYDCRSYLESYSVSEREIRDICTETPYDKDDRHTHVTAAGDTINFSGYNMSKMSEGARLAIKTNSSFTISARITTSTIKPHPGGTFTITLGPISVVCDGTFSYLSINGEYIGVLSGDFDLELVKDHNNYSIKADVIEASRTFETTEETQYVDFNFKHDSHACHLLSSVTVSGIKMRRTSGISITKDSCL